MSKAAATKTPSTASPSTVESPLASATEKIDFIGLELAKIGPMLEMLGLTCRALGTEGMEVSDDAYSGMEYLCESLSARIEAVEHAAHAMYEQLIDTKGGAK